MTKGGQKTKLSRFQWTLLVGGAIFFISSVVLYLVWPEASMGCSYNLAGFILSILTLPGWAIFVIFGGFDPGFVLNDSELMAVVIVGTSLYYSIISAWLLQVRNFDYRLIILIATVALQGVGWLIFASLVAQSCA